MTRVLSEPAACAAAASQVSSDACVPPRSTLDSLGPFDFFEQPVPRRFVHRAAVSEVLLTHFMPDESTDSFKVCAQWPREHSFYRTRAGYHDPLLLSEAIRQTGLLIGHAGYGIPLDHHFIMNRLSFDIDPQGLRRGDAPTDLSFSATCFNLEYRRKQLIGCECTLAVHRDSTRVGTGSYRFVTTSPGVYARMRGQAADPGAREQPAVPGCVEPALVGRDHPADVVLAEIGSRSRWLLRPDLGHPVLFEHAVDHLPGMMLVEAARQAAHRVLQPGHVLVTGMVSEFAKYAELGVLTEVTAQREDAHDDRQTVRVVLTQEGEQVASVLITALVTA